MCEIGSSCHGRLVTADDLYAFVTVRMLSAVLLGAALVVPSTPVTLLSGFLGAGKTTCLSHLLSYAEGVRLGVVVNDVAKLNIDAALISNAASNERDSDVVRLQNGCACCSLSGELNTALRKLSDSGEYDQLIVELSGVANPETAKNNLNQALADDPSLGVALDQVVTLVDSSTFLSYFERDVRVADQPELRESASDAPINPCAERAAVPQLLVNQVEGADVVVLNKLDLVSTNEQWLVEKLVCAFNPDAKLEATQFGEVASDVLLVSSAVGQTAEQRASARKSSKLEQTEDIQPPSVSKPAATARFKNPAVRPKWSQPPADPVLDALGIQSFVYTVRRPFDAGRLMALLQQWPRDDASPLQQVGIDLGFHATDDAMASVSAEERDAKLAAEAQRQLAAWPNKPPLRFTLEDRVECNIGSNWAPGKIIWLWYVESEVEDAAPYQVLLDEGKYIFCPADDDRYVRRAAGDAVAPPPHPFRGVLRSKGWCWLDQPPTMAGFWSHAGRTIELTQAGNWWMAAGDENMRRQLGTGDRYEEAKSHFQGTYGDCRQDLVFIGVEPMDEATIRKALDSCLLNSKEDTQAFERAWAAALKPKEEPKAWWQRNLKDLIG